LLKNWAKKEATVFQSAEIEQKRAVLKFVMPGLVPGIHVLTSLRQKGVDGRVKPGHDEGA